MGLEIHSLRDQLTSLLMLYKDAIINEKPIEERKQIEQQIEKLEMLIEDRKKVIERMHNTN